jgi:ATP-dependent Zn protease
MAQALDLETKKLLEERLEHVQQLLRDKRPLLDRIAAVLLAKEVLDGDAFAQMVRDDVGDSQGRVAHHPQGHVQKEAYLSAGVTSGS